MRVPRQRARGADGAHEEFEAREENFQGHGFGYIRRRRANPFRRRKPAAVRQVGAPLGCPARAGRKRGRAPHRAALRPRALRRLLRGARARAAPLPARDRLGHARRADRADAPRDRGCGGRGGARRRPRLRGHELDARGRPRSRQAPRPGRARRGGPPLLRPLHAGGAEPDARRPSLEPALLPQRGRGGQSRRRGDRRRRPSRRRRHVRRHPSPGADRPRALGRAGAERGGGRRLPRPHAAPGGQRAARAACPHRRGPRALEEPVLFPAHPRTRAVIAEAGIALGPNVRLLPPRATWTSPRSPRRRASSSRTRAACRRRRTGTASPA